MFGGVMIKEKGIMVCNPVYYEMDGLKERYAELYTDEPTLNDLIDIAYKYAEEDLACGFGHEVDSSEFIVLFVDPIREIEEGVKGTNVY
jgi:hypothetical protein